MDYQKVYRDIVERGQVREPDPDVYYEVHHIQPRCMGGGNEKENLTTLTAREHFIAHWLLARIYPGHKGISFAFWGMCNQLKEGKREYKVSSRAYNEGRQNHSKNYSLLFKEDTETRKKLSKSSSKTMENPETREKISEGVKKSYTKKRREEYSKRSTEFYLNEENRKNQSIAIKESWKDDEERRDKMSDRLKNLYLDNSAREENSKKMKIAWEAPSQGLLKNCKISQNDIPDILKMIDDGYSYKDIADRYTVSVRTIQRIKNKETYKWII